MYSALPVIEFDRFVGGSTEGRKKIASDVDEALKTIGSFCIRGHGILQSRIDECFDFVSQLLHLQTLHSQNLKNKAFFNFPNDQKENLTPKSRSFNRGYSGIEQEIIRGRACKKENYDFGGGRWSGSDSWPTEEQLPGFRDFAEEFYQVRSAPYVVRNV